MHNAPFCKNRAVMSEGHSISRGLGLAINAVPAGCSSRAGRQVEPCQLTTCGLIAVTYFVPVAARCFCLPDEVFFTKLGPWSIKVGSSPRSLAAVFHITSYQAPLTWRLNPGPSIDKEDALPLSTGLPKISKRLLP